MTVDRRPFLLSVFGRGERIRTSDPSVPNRVLYQAEPRPDTLEKRTPNGTRCVFRGSAPHEHGMLSYPEYVIHDSNVVPHYMTPTGNAAFAVQVKAKAEA